jgi:carboxyl-terminal processing protease
MLHKGKILIVSLSAVVILYGVSAAFISGGDSAFPALNVFMRALRHVNEDYVEAPDMNKVQAGAMRGLMEALDPYSAFLSKEELNQINATKGSTSGVGLVLSKRSNILCVVASEHGSPAEAAGVRPGDYVTAIDGTNVEDSSLLKAESLLRGVPGSVVKISVFRGSQTKPIEIQMTRKNPEPAVATRMIEGNIGILEIPSLVAPAVEQARLKLKTLISAGAQKLVLDLRDCATGQAQSGAELANFFLKTGVIYTAKDRSMAVLEEVKAAAEKGITDIPMVVLINVSSAGPAEIAAGALKANGRASVIGEKSFGMASIQKQVPLKSGSVLVLSVGKYYTPDGKMIENDEAVNATGIKPDLESPSANRLQELLVDSYFDGQEDAAKYKQLRDKIKQEQLDKAVEVLKKGLQAARQN